MTPPAVLVTDGTERAALAVVRSLGRAGHPVHVVAHQPRSIAGASRWCRSQQAIPSPLHEPAAFRKALREVVERERIGVVLAISEASLLAILEEENVLPEGVLLPFPGLDQFLRVTDKELVLREARALGIATPGQVVLESPSPGLPEGLPPFPLVIKPARSVSGESAQRGRWGVIHVADREELEQSLETLPPEAYPLLLQQRVGGEGIGVFLLLWKGQVRAVSGHRRLREKPPSGGVSVYREAVVPPPALLERSVALLEAFSWEGVAMVEYKMDAAGEVPYLMEINGRFWGSLQLAVDAGVDFPRILVELALGAEPSPPPPIRAGIRSRWWMGEVDHLLARLRRSDEELHLPPGSPGRLSTIRSFLTHRLSLDRSEVLRLSDPAPGFQEMADWLRRR